MQAALPPSTVFRLFSAANFVRTLGRMHLSLTQWLLLPCSELTTRLLLPPNIVVVQDDSIQRRTVRVRVIHVSSINFEVNYKQIVF